MHFIFFRTSEQDEFTARLLKLLEDSEKKGIRQNKTLMITRCDYMLHQPKQSDPIQLQQGLIFQYLIKIIVFISVANLVKNKLFVNFF